MTLENVSIDDKYEKESGRVFISGSQALVRLPVMQRQRDQASKLNTAGFISGYRGSPLGYYDSTLWQAKSYLMKNHIHFEPGVNEDLAATAVWGSQQVESDSKAEYDGVFSIWYGKGPGVDRAGDVFKHGNLAGTSKNSGVLVVFGDDHPGKSSTVAHHSEPALAANNIPVLYPATVQEFIDFGLYGWAMSRYTGLWVGFKTVNETVENTASVEIDPNASRVLLPENQPIPEQGLHFQPNFSPTMVQEEEVLLLRHKLPLAQAFARINKLDRTVFNTPKCRLGIVTAGKSYLDVMRAMELLGIDSDVAQALGIDIYKVGMIWPLEPQGLKSFAGGVAELLFVEEKSAFMEDQAAKILYNLPASERPRIIGKQDEQGHPLLPSDILLEPNKIAQLIATRLQKLDSPGNVLSGALITIDNKVSGMATPVNPLIARIPYFCSGCPHNCSTKVPEGSQAMAGIGCHAMSVYMNRTTSRPTQMGGEGVNWTGIAPFTKTLHRFQNLGDGTYSHSGLLAIRAAVLSKVSITYKILVNDAVAMTGGQPVEGALSVPVISQQVTAQGVKKVAVVTDEPGKYPDSSVLGKGVRVFHRDDLMAVQNEFREIEGTTVIIFEQVCAAEKRRRRKRNQYPDPAKRVFINDTVCEGCGDCSTQSNCVSIQPLETQLGRKRKIDQSNCNKDFSCVKGFCPSFVTVKGGSLRKPVATALPAGFFDELPLPQLPAIDGSYGVLITGIGGTGVVTIGAVLGMAAHIEGKGSSVYDMTGLAQKGGAVLSHLRIADHPEDINTVSIGIGEADLMLGCDLVVSAGKEAMQSIGSGKTRAVINSDLVPTAVFQLNPNVSFESAQLINGISRAVGEEQAHFIDATALAMKLCGNTIASNMFMVGYAFQQGALPLNLESIERAIELNGVAVEFNKQALALGRVAAQDLKRIESLVKDTLKVSEALPESWDEMVASRIKMLTEYQDSRYAQRYKDLVDKVRKAEEEKTPGKSALSEVVARYYFKLMAYKDEYEVARLYNSDEFERKLHAQFEGDFKLEFNLAPPLLSKKDPVTGLPRKKAYGPWVFKAFKVLEKLKGLRGTKWDIFGYSEERRAERALITSYEDELLDLIAPLNPENYETAVELASLPEHIRGYGHVKARHLEQVRRRQEALRKQFNAIQDAPQELPYVELKMTEDAV